LSAQAGPDQLICTGDVATLGGSPSATGGYGAYLYSWTPTGNLNNPQAANPSATPAQSTTYVLNLSDSLGCTAVDTVEIIVDTCIGIQNLQGIHAFDVFPNPNEGRFTVAVELGTTVDILTLQVIDPQGRIVYEKEIVQAAGSIREPISLAGLSRGSYFIRMDADGKQLSRKMMLR
jgi:hypothetical protein